MTSPHIASTVASSLFLHLSPSHACISFPHHTAHHTMRALAVCSVCGGSILTYDRINSLCSPHSRAFSFGILRSLRIFGSIVRSGKRHECRRPCPLSSRSMHPCICVSMYPGIHVRHVFCYLAFTCTHTLTLPLSLLLILTRNNIPFHLRI